MNTQKLANSVHGSTAVTVPIFEETGLPESYRDLYLANPWRDKSATGGFLGIGRRQEQQQFQVNSDQYIADLQASARKEAYESPVQANARLRAAGVNTDLAGLDNAGAAGEAPEASSFPELDPARQASDVAGTMLNLFSLFTGVPNAVADLRGKIIDNRSAILDQIVGMSDIIDSDVSGLRPLQDLPEDASLPNILMAASKSVSRSDDLAKIFWPHDKRMQKMFTDLYPKRQDLLQNQLSRFENLRDLINVQNSPELADAETLRAMALLYSRYQLRKLQNDNWYQTELAKYREKHPDSQQDLFDAENKRDVAEAKNDTARADYDTGLVSKLDVEKQAAAINAQASSSEMQSLEDEYRSRQNKIDLETIEELQDYFADPDAPRNSEKYFNRKFGKNSWRASLKEMRQYRDDRKRFQHAYERQHGRKSGGLKLSVPGIGSIDYRH